MAQRLARRAAPVVVALSLLAACGGSGEPVTTTAQPDSDASSLVGRWERAGSTFTSLDGMIVEVQPDGTEAIIVSVPTNEFQFQAGDIKWRSIESTGDDTYSFDDLVREEGTGATSYVEGVITVTGDGTLEMTFPTTGTVQEWARAEAG